ncbi:MAG: TonB-dependent receptor, partial [Chitinophagaceae bacterium]
TYFNQLAFNNFSSMEIVKGPAGSLYGAGTGGLILIRNVDHWKPGASLEYIRGSYNTQNLLGSVRFGKEEQKNQFTFAHQNADGYRAQSALRKTNFSWRTEWKRSERQSLSASVLYTDLFYETPGALTLNEMNASRRAARPPAAGFPGAVQARAAIDQKNITTGITHTYQLSNALSNHTTVFGMFNQIKNAAIRNYERRLEPGYGGRTVFKWDVLKSEKSIQQMQLVWGAEYQQGNFNTQVFQNRMGNPDTLQTNDDISNTNAHAFAQVDVHAGKGWQMSMGSSINRTRVLFQRLSSYPIVQQTRTYQNEWAPRITLRKKIIEALHFSATLSRGFSPPTLAEILPSTGIINTALEAEYGWNKEASLQYSKRKNNQLLQIDMTAFVFDLNSAMVQRRDASGADFFTNAGEVNQKGIETTIQYWAFRKQTWSDIHIRLDHSYHHFTYANFVQGTRDFSGNKVPSVPTHTLSALTNLQHQKGYSVQLTYYYCDAIWLNDANTASAASYHLLALRLGWKKEWKNRYRLHFYVGGENLLNTRYSLGNDINAAGGRFYNAAPERNFYTGIAFQWQ